MWGIRGMSPPNLPPHRSEGLLRTMETLTVLVVAVAVVVKILFGFKTRTSKTSIRVLHGPPCPSLLLGSSQNSIP